MVEELKLAIKVDDDAIEQSLLKQFANAEKMANKVVLTFNNIDLDDKAIEAKFKEMQKMAGKNPIDLSIDKSSIEMLSAISKQLGNIFDIAKGKSLIDSSATTQIDKLQSKLDELTKKYDELSSKKIGSTVSGKDIDLVDNTEFKRLSDEFSLLKNELTGLKREMQLFEEATVSADTFVAMERNVNGLIVKVDDLIDKYVQLSVAQKNIGTDKSNISSENITNQIVENEKKKQEAYKATADAVMYHAGVISKLNKAETNGRFYGSDRGTGYFGTGHYFVDSATKHELDNNRSYSKLPYTSIDISQYDNLFRATTNEIADGLHTFLKNLTKFTQGSDTYSISELFSQFQKVFGETVMDMQEFDAKLEQLKTYMQNSNISDRGDSVSTQFMKSLGYGGVDTRGTKYADTRYGTVIYDLKEESILQANITDELQKQGQMLEKINYEKGQVFDKSEDTRIQGIIDEQNKVKEIQSEFEKLYDATQLRAYESELDSIDDKLSENKKIIDDCRSSIETADEDARRFAKDFADMFDDEMISDDEIKENADRSRLEYQERISELEEENQLLLARKSEIEANIESEAKLVNAARERAKAIVEERNKPIEDVFQGGTTSAEKLEEGIKNIDSATEKASESAKEYRKILSQVGEFDIDSKVSAMYKRNDGQLESWTWRAKKDEEGNVLYDQNGNIDYDEPTITVISKYEQLEKIIVKADNELRNLQKDLAEIKAYDPTASTTNIETKISDQKEYIQLLEQTVKAISQSDEYLLDEQQIIEARNKAAREYALTTGAKQEKTDAKQSASDEKKRLANIEQVNRALNKQQITIDAIEKTYNKTTNPDLDREVSNQQDLAELAQKKLAIQTKINSLQGKERNSANEKEFLELEKLIAEYKELAKYKLKANNPSKQELGGQNLQTLIQVQISNYDKLITKAEKYGDATNDAVEKLKEQRDILSKMDLDGKYSATADQYYASRDTYKVESAALSAFEAETRAIEQKTQAVKKLSDELEVYNKQVPKKPADRQRSDKFESLVQNYKNAISEAQKYLNTLGDSPVTEEVKKEWKSLIDIIKKVKEEMDSVPTAERGSDALSRGKEIDTITKYLDKFTGISKQAKRELNGLLDQLQSGDPSVNVKKIHERFLELTVAERNAGREARNLFDIFKDKKIYSFLGQAASMFSFYDLINLGRKGFQTIRELDTALTEMRKVSDESVESLKRYQAATFDVGDAVGATAKTIQNSTADFLRLGESMDEAAESAKVANILLNVSEFENIDEATKSLVSMSQAYQELDKTDIVDKLNNIGKFIA